MQYQLKAGTLYQKESQLALAKMKSRLLGPQTKIYSISGELLLTADIRDLDESKAGSGDVRCREYILTDRHHHIIGAARPGYADGENPDVAGWPICRMPRVDHAHVRMSPNEYVLTMSDSRHFSLRDIRNEEALRMTHRDMIGEWIVDNRCGFAPETICGFVMFCRYMAQENEFPVV